MWDSGACCILLDEKTHLTFFLDFFEFPKVPEIAKY
jgi:hypothetical protein